MERGVVGSMIECGVTESYKLKRQVVLSASEAAEMSLRVDDSKFTSHPLIRLSEEMATDSTSLALQSCVPHRGDGRGSRAGLLQRAAPVLMFEDVRD